MKPKQIDFFKDVIFCHMLQASTRLLLEVLRAKVFGRPGGSCDTKMGNEVGLGGLMCGFDRLARQCETLPKVVNVVVK